MKQRSIKGRKPGTNPTTDNPPKAMSSTEHNVPEGEDLSFRSSNFGSRISPSRLTTQVALAVPPEDNYSSSKLHSALTGKLQPHPHLREVAQSSSPVQVPSPGRHLSPSGMNRATPPTSSPYASPLGVRVSPDVHGILPVKLSPSDRLSPRGSGLPTLSPNLPYTSPQSEAPRSSSSPGPPKMSGPFVKPEYNIPFRPYQGDPMVSAGSRMTAPAGLRVLATQPEGTPRMPVSVNRQILPIDREEQKESSEPVALPFSSGREYPTEHRLTEALLRQNIHDPGTLERLYNDYSQFSPSKGTPSPSNKDRLSPAPERVSPVPHPKKDLQRRATPPPPTREPTPPTSSRYASPLGVRVSPDFHGILPVKLSPSDRLSPRGSLLHNPPGLKSDPCPLVDLSKLPPKQRVRLMEQQPASVGSQQQPAFQWQEHSATGSVPVHQPPILDIHTLHQHAMAQQLHQRSTSHQPPVSIPVPVKIPMLIQGQPFISLPRMPVDPQSGSVKVLSGKFDIKAQEALSKQASGVVPVSESMSVVSDIKKEKITQPQVKAEVKKEVPPHQSNPFIFPRSGLKVSPTPTIPSFNTSHLGQSSTPPTAHYPRSRSDISYLRRHDDVKDTSAMPQLIPEDTVKIKPDTKKPTYQEIEEESKKLKPWTGQFNMRLKNLANFPVNSTSYRSAYRAQSVAVQKAKACSVTGAGKTLDLLRQTLQKTINKEIDAVVQKYVEKFFKVGIANIKENTGPTSVTEEHLNSVCRQVLEEAKKMYVVETRSVSPVQDFPDNVSETGSNSGKRWIKKRRLSDSDSEKGGDYVYAKKAKKKGRPLISGRTTPSKIKSVDIVRREGPKWDPERLIPDTLFVMGAKANKALGLGNTRGRLYIKHPDVFKYSGDQEDKQWLYEHHLMPATGGKAYMLIVDDIKDLSETDEYRDGNLLMNELIGFHVPEWMVVKMKAQMQSMRTDKGRFINRSRSATPSEASGSSLKDGEDSSKTLPFSGFSDSPLTISTKPENVASPMDGEMEFLSGTDIGGSNMSPFNLTGGFEDNGSPTQSDIDNLDDDPTYTTPFGLSK